MAVYFAASFLLERYLNKAHKTIVLYTCLLSATILGWCAVIALLDQLSAGQMIMYVAALFTVSVFPLLSLPVFLLVCLPVHILFLILLPGSLPVPDLLFGNIVDTSVCAVVAAVISRALYRSKCRDVINKYVIQEKNKELYEIIEKLLSTNKKLEGFSFTDSLTGLLNRRRLNERLSAEWERCKDSSMPLSLLILDIDCFKRINDIYGHQTGDLCLMRISDILNSSTEDHSDITARWGGEEFVILLPTTDLHQAMEMTERMRICIQKNQYDMVEDVTCSFGLASLQKNDNVESLLRRADELLYHAKERGKNIVAYRLYVSGVKGTFRPTLFEL
jgi:diguanylate cyclase (GGDEF)-like protein